MKNDQRSTLDQLINLAVLAGLDAYSLISIQEIRQMPRNQSLGLVVLANQHGLYDAADCIINAVLK